MGTEENTEEVNNALLGNDDGPGPAEAAAAEVNIGAEDGAAGTNGNAKEDEEVPLTFPQRLMEILSIESYNDIIGWLPHGRGFLIKDKRRFAEEVLPRYFKKSKFTSFTRKLNRWNFVRVTRGAETGAYYHEMFLKENPKLCTQMTCINSKSSQRIEPMNPVALGLGSAGVFTQPDAPDPATQARLQEQRQAFFQHHWQQQQAFMAMMAQQQQAAANKEGGEEGKGDGEDGKVSGDGAASESKNGEEQKQGSDQQPNAAAMAAFQQQQQYYAMFMAHQQQMAAAMSGMTPQQQQAFGFPQGGSTTAGGGNPANGSSNNNHNNGAIGNGNASGEGNASGDGTAAHEVADEKDKPADNGEADRTEEGEAALSEAV